MTYHRESVGLVAKQFIFFVLLPLTTLHPNGWDLNSTYLT